ncbi:response regulator [Clostridium paridis]|uniref:Stage 0 sporulation protein A homolog n=1 Tax=Clostridium paridis TaxID=2803863 RepID=A0A937FDX3_9CLOT|nr:helix-turn-helix domain-containing protein [Clostridium paridis]MBL4931504.1 response regulator [Clostridium paridis]
MYRLLMVDDEKIVIDSISFIIKNNFPNIIYESARSGKEAIEKASYFRPDIVLMDIRMPGLNGIDTIKELKVNFSETMFIVISAYEQFEFAKEALTLGVIDYILKPMNKNTLIASIEKAINKITKEREKRAKELENLEKFQTTLPLLEHNFLYSLIVDNKNFTITEEYKKLLNIDKLGGYLVAIDINSKDSNSISPSIYYSMRDLLKYKYKCLIGPLVLNRILILINSEPNSSTTDIGNYIIKNLSVLYSSISFKIGIGSYKPLEKIFISYEESLIALRSLSNSNESICHINNIENISVYSSDYPKDVEKKLIEFCTLGETDESLKYFNELFNWIQKNFNNNLMKAKTTLIELLVVLHKSLIDSNINIFYNNEYINSILELQNLNELELWFRDKISSSCVEIRKGHRKNISKIIINAKKYISDNYSLDITLDEIAKEACVSPHYFSRLFKEETGENFIDYLTRVRINKAKDLMQNSNISIKEICYKIGYNDPNYFSRLFKKVQKVSPTDYLKSIMIK